MHNKRLPPSMSASDARDWSAYSPARRSPLGTDGWIHDSFCNEEKKKKRRERMWEKKQPRPLGNYTVEQHGGSGIKGIINQAKKQARRSYIYYLHFFHFRRCNQQIYGGRLLCVTGTGRLCTHFDHWPSKCKVGSVLLTALVFLFFFPLPPTIISTQCPLPPKQSPQQAEQVLESCCCLPAL